MSPEAMKAVAFVLGAYVQSYRPMIWLLLSTYFTRAESRPKRADDRWLILMLVSVPPVTTLLAHDCAHSWAGLVGCVVWVVMWFFGFAYYWARALYWPGWYTSAQKAFVGWWSYSCVFLCIFSIGTGVSFLLPPLQLQYAATAVVFAAICFAVLWTMIRRPEIASILADDNVSLPYRIRAHDIDRMTAFELANSFDHLGPQLAAAIIQLQHADDELLDYLLNIESSIVTRLTLFGRLVKAGFFVSGSLLQLYILVDRLPTNINDLLEYFVVLLALYATCLLRLLPFVPSIEHADSIMALGHVPSARTIPALVRGWTTYQKYNGYGEHSQWFEQALRERLNDLNPDAAVGLDEMTARKLDLTLWQSYRSLIKYDDDRLELLRRLIHMPGLAQNQLTRRSLLKIAASKATDHDQIVLKDAARTALELPVPCDLANERNI